MRSGRFFEMVCLSSVACGVLMVSPDASAQQKQMSEKQVDLLNQANKILSQEPADLPRAKGLLEQALSEGERFDLLLLSLGRTMQKMDECREATRLFNEMSFVAHEPSVDMETLNTIKEDYFSQMRQRCSAWLTVTCADDATQIKVGPDALTCGEELKIKPGGYEVVATLGAQTRSYEVTLEGAEERTFNVGLEKKSEDVSLKPPTPEPAEPGFRYGGTVISGVTTLVLTGAAAGVWAYSSGQVDSILTDEYVTTNESGEVVWVDDRPSDWQDREAEAQPWGTAESYAGWAVPVLAGVGVLTTALVFVSESGSEPSSDPQVSLGIDPFTGRAHTSIRFVW